MRCLCIGALLVLVGCGGTSTVAHQSPTPAAASAARSASGAFPSPALGGPTPPQPAITSCSSQIPAGHLLALVTLRGLAGVAVRDVTNPAHGVTRCTITGASNLRFVGATRISYISTASGDMGAAGALYLVDLQTQTTSLVRAWSYGGFMSWVYAWSPDGQTLTYLSSDTTGVQWHVLSAAGDRTLSKLGTVPPRDVFPDDDAMVGFSADGQYVGLEETFTYQYKGSVIGIGPPIQVARVTDGERVYSRTDGTMATWAASGARFYFRTSAGVQFWDPSGKVQSMVGGLSWIRPWASADARHIAYMTVDAQGNHKVDILDTNTGTTARASSEPRVNPAFLAPTLIWYAGESVCTSATPCDLGPPPLTGKTYIYDLAGVETASIDTGFFDSWPHVAGQS